MELNHAVFAVMINVLALADLYKEPIDGLSVDHVLQEITHKDMCHGAGCVRRVCVYAVVGGATPVDINGFLISQ